MNPAHYPSTDCFLDLYQNGPASDSTQKARQALVFTQPMRKNFEGLFAIIDESYDLTQFTTDSRLNPAHETIDLQKRDWINWKTVDTNQNQTQKQPLFGIPNNALRLLSQPLGFFIGVG